MDKKQEITACAFIYNQQGQLFIARRAATKKFLPNTYELPGGHTEFGETLEESLIRELKEEFEVNIVVENPFYAFTYLSSNKTIHTVEVDFFARLSDVDQKIKLHAEDHSEYRWITPDEINQYFAQNDEEKKAIEKGFSLLKSKS